MIQQTEFTLRPRTRGFHLVTDEITANLPTLPVAGLVHLFMPAHAKSTLTGVELTIPVTQGRLNLGTWQGIYLCEFRNRASGRRIVATLIG